MGATEGIHDQLDRIEAMAASLRDEASTGIKRCTALLAETQSQDLPS
jgi:hypothetical protein